MTLRGEIHLPLTCRTSGALLFYSNCKGYGEPPVHRPITRDASSDEPAEAQGDATVEDACSGVRGCETIGGAEIAGNRQHSHDLVVRQRRVNAEH